MAKALSATKGRGRHFGDLLELFKESESTFPFVVTHPLEGYVAPSLIFLSLMGFPFQRLTPTNIHVTPKPATSKTAPNLFKISVVSA